MFRPISPETNDSVWFWTAASAYSTQLERSELAAQPIYYPSNNVDSTSHSGRAWRKLQPPITSRRNSLRCRRPRGTTELLRNDRHHILRLMKTQSIQMMSLGEVLLYSQVVPQRRHPANLNENWALDCPFQEERYCRSTSAKPVDKRFLNRRTLKARRPQTENSKLETSHMYLQFDSLYIKNT